MKVKDILELLDEEEQDIVIVRNIKDYHYKGHWFNNFDKRMIKQWGDFEVLSLYGYNDNGYNGICITVKDEYAV